MLTRASLISVDRSLRDSLVPSVYLDGSPRDPAMRGMWRAKLNDAVAAARAAITDRSELRQFDAASALLHIELESVPVPAAAESCFALATAQGIGISSSLAYRTPLLVRWGRVAIVAPALRAIGGESSVLVALADSRSARILRYSGGILE